MLHRHNRHHEGKWERQVHHVRTHVRLRDHPLEAWLLVSLVLSLLVRHWIASPTCHVIAATLLIDILLFRKAWAVAQKDLLLLVCIHAMSILIILYGHQHTEDWLTGMYALFAIPLAFPKTARIQ